MRSVFAKRDFAALHNMAIKFGHLWGIQEAPRFINDSENIVYEFESKNLILRLTEQSHRNNFEIKEELAFIEYLSQFSTNVCKPIRSNNNVMMETLDYKSETLTACVFIKATGNTIEDLKLLKASFPIEMGELVGDLHYHSKKFSFQREEYVKNDHLENFSLYLKDNEAKRECEKALNWYSSLPKSKNAFGPIHGDIHFGNMFYSSVDGIQLFDFDDCSNGFYIFDVGIHLYYALGMFTYHNGESHFENYKRRFIASYKSKNALDPIWFNLIDDVLRFRSIDLYVWMHKMFDLSNLTNRQSESLFIYKQRISKNLETTYKRI